MKGLLAFLFALVFMGLFSLPYESWGMPVWPICVMTLLVGLWLGLIPGLEKYRIPLAIIYFAVFSLMWLQSFPRPITPRATLHYFRGAAWLATYTIFGIIAFFTLVTTMLRAAQDNGKLKGVLWVTLALMLASALAFLSGPGGGADPLMQWLTTHGFSIDTALKINLVIRKCIHFTFYGTLALVAGTGAQAVRSAKVPRPEVVGFLFMLGHAVFDEVRQSGVSVRTGSAFDVMLDCAGALVFLYLASRNWKRTQKSAP